MNAMTSPDTVDCGYDVKDGRIVSPGKFEGEPAYVPHFWDVAMDGLADDDVDGLLFFELGEEDYKQFPELVGYSQLSLYEDSQGFVHSNLFYRINLD